MWEELTSRGCLLGIKLWLSYKFSYNCTPFKPLILPQQSSIVCTGFDDTELNFNPLNIFSLRSKAPEVSLRKFHQCYIKKEFQCKFSKKNLTNYISITKMNMFSRNASKIKTKQYVSLFHEWSESQSLWRQQNEWNICFLKKKSY